MEKILLCSHNPIFVKSLYGILFEVGMEADVAEHHSEAITKILTGTYAAVIIDADQSGLSAAETTRIINGVCPGIPIIVAGSSRLVEGALTLETPINLEEFKDIINTVSRFCKPIHT